MEEVTLVKEVALVKEAILATDNTMEMETTLVKIFSGEGSLPSRGSREKHARGRVANTGYSLSIWIWLFGQILDDFS